MVHLLRGIGFPVFASTRQHHLEEVAGGFELDVQQAFVFLPDLG